MQHHHLRSCLCVLAAYAVLTVTVLAQQPAPVADIFDGLDPVELMAGREVPGRDSLAIVHRGYRYLFASPQNVETFRKNPDRYEPASGGTCARMGAGGPGNPALFTVFDGRIYLFSSDRCRKAFESGPEKYLEPALVSGAVSETQRAKGRAIVERAVQAVGGAARLDAITGYELVRNRLRGTPQGPQTIPEQMTVLFPGAVRLESRTPHGTMVAAAAGDDMFMAASTANKSQVMRWPEAPRVAVARDMSRRLLLEPIGLLRSRLGSTVVMAAIEPPSGDDGLEYVRITVGDWQSVLAIRRDSGLPVALTYSARNRDGIFAPLTLTFSDYRDIAGLRVPFVVDASFGAQKSAEESYVLTSWMPNPSITLSGLMRETIAPPQDK